MPVFIPDFQLNTRDQYRFMYCSIVTPLVESVTEYIQFFFGPMGIWVRIPLPKCGKSQLNGVLLIEMFKPLPCVTYSRCSTIKIPPFSKVVNAKRRPKFCIPHPTCEDNFSVKVQDSLQTKNQ